MTGKLKVTGLEEKRRFRCCLEGHLDAAGAVQGKTGKELLAELAATRTVAELTQEVNRIIDPYEAQVQSVYYLLDRFGINCKAEREMRPGG